MLLRSGTFSPFDAAFHSATPELPRALCPAGELPQRLCAALTHGTSVSGKRAAHGLRSAHLVTHLALLLVGAIRASRGHPCLVRFLFGSVRGMMLVRSVGRVHMVLPRGFIVLDVNFLRGTVLLDNLVDVATVSTFRRLLLWLRHWFGLALLRLRLALPCEGHRHGLLPPLRVRRSPLA